MIHLTPFKLTEKISVKCGLCDEEVVCHETTYYRLMDRLFPSLPKDWKVIEGQTIVCPKHEIKLTVDDKVYSFYGDNY